MELLNGRVVGRHLKTEIERAHKDRESGSVPLVVRGTELRVALNWECIGAIAKRTGIRPVVVAASITSGANELLSKRDMTLLFDTSGNQTNNLTVLLPLMVGMPVRITQNIAVELGVANGTEGTLLGTYFRPIHDSKQNVLCSFAVSGQ